MLPSPNTDRTLRRFRAALDQTYGDRLERVVLYGWRARGDHRPASDYDIAVFIKDPGTLRDEVHRLASEVILPDLFDGPINITYL